MIRRELFRRSILGTLAAALSSVVSGRGGSHTHPPPREFPPDYDYSEILSRPDWKPGFLSDHQNRTLTELGDLIIPETDTPGARGALVNRFIDHLLAVETRETQKDFLASLSYIDGFSRERYGSAFIFLPRETQVELLNFLAYPHRLITWGQNRPDFQGHVHFSRIKSWVTRSYYNSEAGMKELGWDGDPFHGPYEGCRHAANSHQ